MSTVLHVWSSESSNDGWESTVVEVLKIKKTEFHWHQRVVGICRTLPKTQNVPHPVNNKQKYVTCRFLFLFLWVQDGGFPNCKVNFDPWGQSSGYEGKEDIVCCSKELKISTSHLRSLCVRRDFGAGGKCVKTCCVTEQVVCEKRGVTGSFLCGAAPRPCVQSAPSSVFRFYRICCSLILSLFVRVCRRFSVFYAAYILILYTCGSSMGPVPSPESHRFVTTWHFSGLQPVCFLKNTLNPTDQFLALKNESHAGTTEETRSLLCKNTSFLFEFPS